MSYRIPLILEMLYLMTEQFKVIMGIKFESKNKLFKFILSFQSQPQGGVRDLKKFPRETVVLGCYLKPT